MERTPEPEATAGKLGGLVTPAGEPENAVLVDDARLVRWAGPAFALFSLVAAALDRIPGVLAASPAVSPHYAIAWAGFDVILLVVLAETA